MRQQKDSNIVIEYPNEVAFAFSQLRISVVAIAATRVNVTVRKKGVASGRTESREMYAGVCSFDISGYVQLLFGDVNLSALSMSMQDDSVVSELLRDIECDVELFNASDVSIKKLTFSMIAIWGAIGIDELFGKNESVRWFVNYPFTINVMGKQDLYMDATADGVDLARVFNLSPNRAIDNRTYEEYIVNVRKLFRAVKKSLYLAFPFAVNINNDVIVEGMQSWKIKIDNTNSGVYLRWIDRQGRYKYWLFSAGPVGIKSEQEAQILQGCAGVGYTNKVYDGLSYRREKSTADVMQCVAVMVNRDEYEYIRTIIGSSVVDMYMGDDRWRRVNIGVGNYTDSGKHIQDFAVNVELEEKQYQRL